MPLTMTPVASLTNEVEMLRVEIMSLKSRIDGVNRLLHTGNIPGESAIQVYEELMKNVFDLFLKRERLIKDILDTEDTTP